MRGWVVLLCAGLAVGLFAQSRQLMPGDSLKITCPTLPSLCVIRTIDGSGVVWLPMLGYVAAVDMDRDKFQSRIAAMLFQKFGRKVQVGVEPYRCALDPIHVEGLVTTPISRKWGSGLSVRALLRDVKVREDGDPDHVVLIDMDGRRLNLDLSSDDAMVRPGDRIVIEPFRGSVQVVVVGPVAKPGGISTFPAMTLARVIEKAGGLTGHGDSSHITLRHPNGSVEILDLKKDGSTTVSAGDWIGVGTNQTQLFVSISGRVAHPGLTPFRKGMTLTEAIRDAGGDPAKLGDSVKITRILSKTMRSSKYHLARIVAKMDLDPVLQPSDSISLGGR